MHILAFQLWRIKIAYVPAVLSKQCILLEHISTPNIYTYMYTCIQYMYIYIYISVEEIYIYINIYIYGIITQNSRNHMSAFSASRGRSQSCFTHQGSLYNKLYQFAPPDTPSSPRPRRKKNHFFSKSWHGCDPPKRTWSFLGQKMMPKGFSIIIYRVIEKYENIWKSMGYSPFLLYIQRSLPIGNWKRPSLFIWCVRKTMIVSRYMLVENWLSV